MKLRPFFRWSAKRATFSPPSFEGIRLRVWLPGTRVESLKPASLAPRTTGASCCHADLSSQTLQHRNLQFSSHHANSNPRTDGKVSLCLCYAILHWQMAGCLPHTHTHAFFFGGGGDCVFLLFFGGGGGGGGRCSCFMGGRGGGACVWDGMGWSLNRRATCFEKKRTDRNTVARFCDGTVCCLD